MSAQCPAGAGPGSTITIMANHQKMSVQVPAGVSAGMHFTINVPMPQQPTPQAQAVPVQQQSQEVKSQEVKVVILPQQGSRPRKKGLLPAGKRTKKKLTKEECYCMIGCHMVCLPVILLVNMFAPEYAGWAAVPAFIEFVLFCLHIDYMCDRCCGWRPCEN